MAPTATIVLNENYLKNKWKMEMNAVFILWSASPNWRSCNKELFLIPAIPHRVFVKSNDLPHLEVLISDMHYHIVADIILVDTNVLKIDAMFSQTYSPPVIASESSLNTRWIYGSMPDYSYKGSGTNSQVWPQYICFVQYLRLLYVHSSLTCFVTGKSRLCEGLW